MAKYLLWPRLDFVAARQVLAMCLSINWTVIIDPAASVVWEDRSGQEPQIFSEAARNWTDCLTRALRVPVFFS